MKPLLKSSILALGCTAAFASGALTQDASAQTVAHSISNPNYASYPDKGLIQRDLSELARVYRRNYTKFIAYPTPNGGHVYLVATDGMSDEQLLRAYNILDFYLTNVPGSQYGADKSSVANAMADNGAVLVLPGGADGESPTPNRALAGQPLYALEFPTEGSVAYINNDFDQRDAGFEEIFHLVHDYGIGTKYTPGVLQQTYQAEISTAMQNGLDSKLWGDDPRAKDWIAELAAEGSLEQEYIASVLDSYYGYWGAWTEAPGGMWGIYAAKTREELRRVDPMGAALVPQFLSEELTYMARIDPAFEGIFDMSFDASKPYTHKSQYLTNVRLLGDNPSGIEGNSFDNIFIGNTAANVIDGKAGHDVVQFSGASSDYNVETTGVVTTVRSLGDPNNVDHLSNIEVLRFTDKDIAI